VSDRYESKALIDFAGALFTAAGMPADRATVVARLLVEADLMGHDTHGLNLAAGYLAALENRHMAATGDPEIVVDRGAVLTWDGGYLSGLWLVSQAIDEGLERAAKYGTVTIVIRRSHHIGCLAAFLPRATEQGMMVTVMSSDPSEIGVTPHGGVQALFTPDPIAVGIPTDGDPLLIDISASATTLGLSGRFKAEGRRLPGPWLVDADGRATDDPTVLDADPPGALLPLGGLDRGHKGFGLALMVEAMTSGLAGFGRTAGADRWGASVFVQLFDPAAFGGIEEFRRETGGLARACRAARVAPGNPAVRIPGDGALARKRKALADGVVLYPAIMPALVPFAERYGCTVPAALP